MRKYFIITRKLELNDVLVENVGTESGREGLRGMGVGLLAELIHKKGSVVKEEGG